MEHFKNLKMNHQARGKKNQGGSGRDINEAADEIIVHFSKEFLQEIAGMPEADLLQLWCKYGQFIRNRLSLWQNYNDNEDESPNPDMFSYLILRNVWEKLATNTLK